MKYPTFSPKHGGGGGGGKKKKKKKTQTQKHEPNEKKI
jgi:hypothetical protein